VASFTSDASPRSSSTDQLLPEASREIVRIAEQTNEGYIRFAEGATKRLVKLAQRRPYMVRLI
jgi:hypothetical protein